MWRLWKGCRGFTRIMPGLEETYKERLDCFLWNSGQWRKTWVHNIMKGIDRVDSQNPFFQRWKYQILEDTGNPLIFWRLIDPSPPLIRTNLWAHLKFPPEVPLEMWRQDWVRPLISTWVQSSAARVSALRVLWVLGKWCLGPSGARRSALIRTSKSSSLTGARAARVRNASFTVNLIYIWYLFYSGL